MDVEGHVSGIMHVARGPKVDFMRSLNLPYSDCRMWPGKVLNNLVFFVSFGLQDTTLSLTLLSMPFVQPRNYCARWKRMLENFLSYVWAWIGLSV
jgi:hypothetical protein